MTAPRRALAGGMLAAIVALAGAARAQPSPDFARQLMSERDYFRAITVYKELAFRETEPGARAFYRYQIGQAYRLSHRPDLSSDVLARLRTQAPPELAGKIEAQLGFNDLTQGIPASAAQHLARAEALGEGARAELGLGLIDLDEGHPGVAQLRFARALEAAPDESVRGLARQLHEAAGRYEARPQKTPWLAGLLSAVVPGAGQLYAGHPVDAAQAFGFVGAFAFTTFLAYQYDRRREGPYVFTGISLSITAILHLANVLGAERTARYYNQHQDEVFLGPLRRRALGLVF
jgi:hypothetical protein